MSGGYGRYTLLVAIAAYSSVILGEWIIAGYQRFVLSGDPEERDAAEKSLVWLCVVLIAGSLGAVPLAALLQIDPLDVAAAALLTWGLTLFQMVMMRLIMAERSVFAAAAQTLASCVKFAVVIWVATATRSASLAVLATGCSLLLISALLLLDRQHPLHRPDLGSLRRLWSFGVYMIVMSVALNSMATADRFLLAALTSAATVGRYSASYLLAEQAILILPSVLMLAVTPRITWLWEAGERRGAGALATEVALLHVNLCVPMVTVLAVYGRDITRIAFGPTFADAVIPPVVGVAVVLMSLSTYANFGLRMQKRTRRQATQSVAGMIVNVVLVMILVPYAGAAGAALATLIAYGFIAIWSLLDNRWFIDVPQLLQGFLVIVAPGAAVVAVAKLTEGGARAAVALAGYGALTAVQLRHRRALIGLAS